MQNWKDLLVCICTPTSGDDQGVYGTAVPIGPGLLLTARHVVRPSALDPPRQRHSEKAILIRWWYAQDPAFSDFVALPTDDDVIVWESSELDVVLLSVPHPKDEVGRGKCRLLCCRPEDGKRWYSEGFPKVYAFDGERRPQSCGGAVYSKSDQEDIFEITADDLEQEGDWAGASGMPVMVEGKVLGVVLQVPSGMRGARLHAAPVWKLLEDRSFREFIHPGEEGGACYAVPVPNPPRSLEQTLHLNITGALSSFHFVRTRGLDLKIGSVDEDIQPNTLAARGVEGDALRVLNAWALDPHGQPRFALLGETGMGKTATTLAFANELLNARTKEPMLPLPIYLDLRHVGDAAKGELGLYQILNLVLHRTFVHSDTINVPSPEEIIRLVRHERAIVIFDGLDEVLSHLTPAGSERFVHEIYSILPASIWLPRRAPGASGAPGRVLVTCRTNYFRTLRDQNIHMTAAHRDDVRADDYRVLVLLPFKSRQIREYLRHTLPGEAVDKLLERIKAVYRLRELAGRPYTLSLIARDISKIEKWEAKGRPLTRVDIYHHVVRSWLERDLARHQLTPDHKRQLMGHFSAALWRSGKDAWSVSDLDQWLMDFLRAHPALAEHYTHRSRELLKDDLRAATFLEREGDSRFRFAHTSLGEYFLATYLFDALNSGKLDDWALPRVSRETLDFLGQLMASDESASSLATLRRIGDRYRPGVSEQVLDYCLFAAAKRYPFPSLTSFNFDGADLRWWQIGRAEQVTSLRRASLKDAQLEGAILINVDADEADFAGAGLARTEWHGGSVRGASFAAADAAGAIFRNVDLENSSFERISLHRTRFIGCRLAGSSGLSASAPKAFFAVCDPSSQFITRPPKKARLLILDGHYDAVSSCAFSSDGGHLVSSSSDGTLRVWDVWSLECLLILHSPKMMIKDCAVFGGTLASAGADGTVSIWNLRSGKCEATLRGHKGSVNAVSFSADGKLVSASDDGTLRVWDTAAKECVFVLRGHTREINRCVVSADRKLIASAGSDRTLRLWRAKDGECLAVMEGHQGAVWDCAFSPDAKMLASASEDHTVRLWNTLSEKEEVALRGHDGPVRACCLSDDGRRLVSGSTDRTLRIWDTRYQTCLEVIRGHLDRIERCVVSPDGTLLSSASRDRTLRLWDVKTGRGIATLRGYENSVRGCAYDPSGDLVASAANDGVLRLWETSSGRCTKILTGHFGAIQNCTFSEDGRLVASSSYDRTVRIWDRKSGTCLQVLHGHEEGVRCCAFHPSGTVVASASYDRTVRLWDIASGRCLDVLRGHEDRVLGCAISPDGRHVASVSNDRTLRLWDVQASVCSRVLLGHQAPVQGCAFSRDGRFIVTASYDGTLRIWRLDVDTPSRLLEGHEDRVLGCAVALDGKFAASASADCTLRIWNTEKGECVTVLRGHTRGVRSCAFSPDSMHLVSSGEDSTVRLWDLASGRQVGFQAHLITRTDFVSQVPSADRILQASGDVWRWVGWSCETESEIARYPAEVFGPLP